MAREKCDHAGKYRVVGGVYVAIRYCVGCGKSWRLPLQGDYIGLGDHPIAEWEPIKEPVEVEYTTPYYDGTEEEDEELEDDE